MLPIDPLTIKRGDVFYESEYGSTIYGIALEDVRVNPDNNHWGFDAFMSDNRIVAYSGLVSGSAYNPDIQSLTLSMPPLHFDLDKLTKYLNADERINYEHVTTSNCQDKRDRSNIK